MLLMSQKAPVNGPPAEKSITLSSLMAPKLGYGDTRPDEPFAFQSREFLRKLLIGKRSSSRLNIRSLLSKESLGLSTSTAKVCKEVVKNGWASVKSLEKSRDGVSEDFESCKACKKVHARPNLVFGAVPHPRCPTDVALSTPTPCFRKWKTSHWLLWSSGYATQVCTLLHTIEKCNCYVEHGGVQTPSRSHRTTWCGTDKEKSTSAINSKRDKQSPTAIVK